MTYVLALFSQIVQAQENLKITHFKKFNLFGKAKKKYQPFEI